LLLLDNSAWARLLMGRVPEARQEAALDWLEQGRLATCLPFLLEAGFSARGAEDHRLILSRLGQLPHLRIDGEIEGMARTAQRELAEAGHHRLPPSDLITAACAHSARGGVLHYDRDYDLIAERTSLRFESVWVAEPGSVD
jgi:predicted nucleic acid-binding protein